MLKEAVHILNSGNQSPKNSIKSNLLLYIITAFIASKEFPKLAQLKIGTFVQVNTAPSVAKQKNVCLGVCPDLLSDFHIDFHRK